MPRFPLTGRQAAVLAGSTAVALGAVIAASYALAYILWGC